MPPEPHERVGIIFGGSFNIHFGVLSEPAAGWDMYAGYYVLRHLVTAASLARGRSADNENNVYEAWLFAGRAIAHAFPESLIDPWIGLEIGFASARQHEDNSNGPSVPVTMENHDTAFFGESIGLDVVLFRIIGIGPHARLRQGFGEATVQDLGVHIEGRF